MASIFQIISYKNKDSLYLRLSGDFDEYSTYDLINTLKKYDTGFLGYNYSQRPPAKPEA